MSDNYSDEIDAGLKAQPTASYEHVLSVDELPKHSNELAGYAIANPPYAPEPDADAKHWYESKTIWFNLITGAASMATLATPALEHAFTAVDFAIVLAIVNLINAVLRKFTDKPIKPGGA